MFPEQWPECSRPSHQQDLHPGHPREAPATKERCLTLSLTLSCRLALVHSLSSHLVLPAFVASFPSSMFHSWPLPWLSVVASISPLLPCLRSLICASCCNFCLAAFSGKRLLRTLGAISHLSKLPCRPRTTAICLKILLRCSYPASPKGQPCDVLARVGSSSPANDSLTSKLAYFCIPMSGSATSLSHHLTCMSDMGLILGPTNHTSHIHHVSTYPLYYRWSPGLRVTAWSKFAQAASGRRSCYTKGPNIRYFATGPGCAVPTHNRNRCGSRALPTPRILSFCRW